MTSVTHEPPAEPPADPPVPSREEIADELEAAAEEVEQAHEDRRHPSTIGGMFYLVVLAVGTAGIAIAWAGDWRLGIRCLAAGLCFAALLRRDAGMLAVRHRLVDIVVLGGMGAALFFLATTIPNQPG